MSRVKVFEQAAMSEGRSS